MRRHHHDGGLDFNPRPHVEGDKEGRKIKRPCWDFNPRPHVEGDTQTLCETIIRLKFQSTPSRGG